MKHIAHHTVSPKSNALDAILAAYRVCREAEVEAELWLNMGMVVQFTLTLAVSGLDKEEGLNELLRIITEEARIDLNVLAHAGVVIQEVDYTPEFLLRLVENRRQLALTYANQEGVEFNTEMLKKVMDLRVKPLAQWVAETDPFKHLRWLGGNPLALKRAEQAMADQAAEQERIKQLVEKKLAARIAQS